MGEYGFRSQSEDEVEGHVSIPLVVLASLLCGAGIFLTIVWLATLQWIYFSGLGLTVAGFLVLMSRRTALDSAE